MGKIICTGLGPGDPDLISVRSDRLIRAARHVAYFRKAGSPGQARSIVEGMLAHAVTEYPMEYPVTIELPFESAAYRQALASFYDDWAARLARLAETEDVVVLCEGDPFFYGSFMYIFARLAKDFPCAIVPGVTSMTASATALRRPLSARNEVV
ncbi:MAG: precorrin-2 C(20)-methyltransferase, partial [Bradyrhizobium sp.]|uniref:SAM-dependent methyltransferase n=1 Tax=Bradyrhizobium sp. TaxID=376 RepID=UPI001A192DE4